MGTWPEAASGQSLNPEAPEVEAFLGDGGRQRWEARGAKEAGGRPAGTLEGGVFLFVCLSLAAPCDSLDLSSPTRD